jgi:hypothetical protein
MNGEFDPLGAFFLVAWLTAVGFAVFKLFQRPRRTIWHWLLLIAGVLLAFGVFFGGELLYAFVRSSLPF